MLEILVGIDVSDEAGYQAYRDAMTPLLIEHGGGFRYDFTIAETLKSATPDTINRLFIIYFPDEAAKTAFFGHPTYQAIKAAHFTPSVRSTTILARFKN